MTDLILWGIVPIIIGLYATMFRRREASRARRSPLSREMSQDTLERLYLSVGSLFVVFGVVGIILYLQ